jgi:rRNA maturation endonuclease Nob1
MDYNLECKCSYFEIGIKEIQSFMMLAGSQGLYYNAKDFEYCPWCGKRLLMAKRQSMDSRNMYYIEEKGVTKIASSTSR